jgi:CRISPR/Cas system-associated endonuclease Cas1
MAHVRRSDLALDRESASRYQPSNSVLSYLYAILEAEARLACLAVGPAPGLGVLYADQKARDSLALDIVEPVRPLVDRFALRVLTERGARGRLR